MKSIQEIKTDFEQILSDVIKINGLPIEQATSVAQVILSESGKFQRTAMLNSSRNGNGKQLATPSQIRAMRNLQVNFPETISKSEASKLIEQAVQKFNGKKQ